VVADRTCPRVRGLTRGFIPSSRPGFNRQKRDAHSIQIAALEPGPEARYASLFDKSQLGGKASAPRSVFTSLARFVLDPPPSFGFFLSANLRLRYYSTKL